MRQPDQDQTGGKSPRRLVLALPILVWLASGLTPVPDGERAISGATILHAGLHFLAPWPFRRVTWLDDGAVHDIALPTTPPLHALFRIGLSDAAALTVAGTGADPDTLVACLAAATAVARPTDLDHAEKLPAALTQDLAAAGIDLLAITVPPQKPPTPAEAVPAPLIIAAQAEAAASRIAAKTKAAENIAAARAKAAEIVDAARADLVNFTADQSAAHAGGRAFLLERYFTNLSSALAQSPKTIIDHRLNWPEAPELDLRPPSALGTGEATK